MIRRYGYIFIICYDVQLHLSIHCAESSPVAGSNHYAVAIVSRLAIGSGSIIRCYQTGNYSKTNVNVTIYSKKGHIFIILMICEH